MNGFSKALYKRRYPALPAVPTTDHYYPLLVLLGTVGKTDRVTVLNKACVYGCLSMTGYLFDEDGAESLDKDR